MQTFHRTQGLPREGIIDSDIESLYMQGIIPRLAVETGDWFVNLRRCALVLYGVDCMQCAQ